MGAAASVWFHEKRTNLSRAELRHTGRSACRYVMLTGRIAEDFRLPRQEPVGKQLLFCRFKADTADGCREALPSIPFSRNSRIAFSTTRSASS